MGAVGVAGLGLVVVWCGVEKCRCMCGNADSVGVRAGPVRGVEDARWIC